jgi:hypothetical protein
MTSRGLCVVAAGYGLRSAALAPGYVDPADVHEENSLTATFSEEPTGLVIVSALAADYR